MLVLLDMRLLEPNYFGFDSHRFALLGWHRVASETGKEATSRENSTFFGLGGLDDIRGHTVMTIFDILAKMV